MPRPAAAYPFPADEDPRQTAWWDAVGDYDRKRWAPVLRAMTPAMRREFHADRRATAAKYALGQERSGGAYYVRQEHEHGLLLRYWTARAEVRP